MPPTISQQRGIAYAPIPFGVISFLSSSYVIYHILYQQPQKRKRLYHRLVLAMNVALLPLSFTYVWSTMAVPVGTPNFVGAMGTVNTCTAQGFISMMFTLTVPVYYGSLVLQAYMGIKNNFREEKYRWIENVVHLFAFSWPCAMATIIAATQNFNPNGSGCWYAKSPQGCESGDPDNPCERGMDIKNYYYVFGLSQIFLYLIFPPAVILAMYCWLKNVQKEALRRCHAGMAAVREAARKHMMQSVYRQISLYLFSFWGTWVFGLILSIYKLFSGNMAYNLLIFCNCIFASQGLIFMLVYFTLQRMGRPKIDFVQHARPSRQLTVSDIRSNTEKRKTEAGAVVAPDYRRENSNFNIFDGTPDEDSPWAMFIDQDIDDEESPDDGKRTP